MSRTILDLEPKRVWGHFNNICAIPRGSENEGGIKNYIIERARSQKLECNVDKAGNVIVKKDATKKGKGVPVILQAHMDMVCEKDAGVKWDFLREPVIPVVDGEWVRAKGTSLGADNGIGLSACLAVMESTDLVHGPCEFLFTVDEETTMKGAYGLSADSLKGRILFNMDSESEGVLFIGSSGDDKATIEFPIKRVAPSKGQSGLKIGILGLLGGHSGLDIHLQRGSAVKLLARLIAEIRDKYEICLSMFNGGEKPNAIPRSADAVITVDSGSVSEVEKFAKSYEDVFKYELGDVAAKLKILTEAASVESVLSNDDFLNVLNFFNLAPQGPISVSPYMKGLVQTSCNVGISKVEGRAAFFCLMSRSSAPSELTMVRKALLSLTDVVKGKFEITAKTPVWKPNIESSILKVMKKTAAKVYGREPEIKTMHASLECGVIGDKYPGMDIISFGPEIENCHSPNERVNIASVGSFWKLLAATLEDLAK